MIVQADFPEVLLQIHYHLRPGGVTTVIDRYAHAFNSIHKGRGIALTIASVTGCDRVVCDNHKIIPVPECDYSTFSLPSDVSHLENHLSITLGKFLSEFTDVSVAVIGHNLTLGRNIALSGAFRQLALEFGSDRYRFFSMIHDFAEEGRQAQMKQIIDLENAGLPVRKKLYAIGAPVHFVVPGSRDELFLRERGFPISHLRNPVETDDTTECVDKENILGRLQKCALSKKLRIDTTSKICYYPSRFIVRKNYLEAIALVCLGLNGTLLGGYCGKSEIDLVRYKKVLELIQKYKLSVLLNTPDLLTEITEEKSDPVSLAFKISDMVISTSIAEGFGYSYYDCWRFDKPIIARKPLGYSEIECIEQRILYPFLPLPVEWVPMKDLERKYSAAYYKCFQEELPWKIDETVCREGYVDFGALDESTQLQCLEKILENAVMMREWKKILEDTSSVWPGLANLLKESQTSVLHHKQAVKNTFNRSKFLHDFKICFSQIPENNEGIDPMEIQKYFQTGKNFRLLLTPEVL